MIKNRHNMYLAAKKALFERTEKAANLTGTKLHFDLVSFKKARKSMYVVVENDGFHEIEHENSISTDPWNSVMSVIPEINFAV